MTHRPNCAEMPPTPMTPTAMTPQAWTASLPALYAAECDDYGCNPLLLSPVLRRTLVPDRVAPRRIMFNDDPFELEIAAIMVSRVPPPAHPARETAQRRAALILHHLRRPTGPPGLHDLVQVESWQRTGEELAHSVPTLTEQHPASGLGMMATSSRRSRQAWRL